MYSHVTTLNIQPLRHMCSLHFLRKRVRGGGTNRRARGWRRGGTWESALVPHRPRRSPSSMAPRMGGVRPSSSMAAGRLATGRAAAQGLDQGRAGARVFAPIRPPFGWPHAHDACACSRPTGGRKGAPQRRQARPWSKAVASCRVRGKISCETRYCRPRPMERRWGRCSICRPPSSPRPSCLSICRRASAYRWPPWPTRRGTAWSARGTRTRASVREPPAALRCRTCEGRRVASAPRSLSSGGPRPGAGKRTRGAPARRGRAGGSSGAAAHLPSAGLRRGRGW
mmetsp:Transcript_4246/g.11044  ORF Transcript_4246/g.11044 Transcript_4246/m.11044 type:complete len:283 (+) Transcript_4246:40-888(+)